MPSPPTMYLTAPQSMQNAAVVFEGPQIKCVLPQSELCPQSFLRGISPPALGWLRASLTFRSMAEEMSSLTIHRHPKTIATIAAAHRKFRHDGSSADLHHRYPRKICEPRWLPYRKPSEKNPSVLGIHLEGPFLSPEKAGVHDPDLMRAPDEADLEMLCGEWTGEMLVTLAPERVPSGFVAKLTKAGRRVSLGHSMATYEETCSAMAEGLAGFTHLFNAMRPLQSREPGPIAAALESPAAWYGLIVDGWHVSPAHASAGLARMRASDAGDGCHGSGGGPQSTFHLYGSEIKVVDGRCLQAGRHFGRSSARYGDRRPQLREPSPSLPDRKPCALPREIRPNFIGVGHMLGRLAPGYRADMVAIDPEPVAVLGTWVAGRRASRRA